MALLKLGIAWSDLQDMPIDEGDALLEAFDEIVNPNRPTKFIVRRKKKKKK